MDNTNECMFCYYLKKSVATYGGCACRAGAKPAQPAPPSAPQSGPVASSYITVDAGKQGAAVL